LLIAKLASSASSASKPALKVFVRAAAIKFSALVACGISAPPNFLFTAAWPTAMA
jgi:hypothetical protein